MWRRLFLLVAGLLPLGCTNLIFVPMADHVLAPDQIGLAYRDVGFEAADGVKLHGWFLPAQAVGKTVSKGRAGERTKACTLLFAHGNAENVSTHIASVWWLPAEGVNVFLFDYRGYGRSGGKPDLAGAHLDFAAALERLMVLPEVDPGRVVVLGQSLGGSIAIVGLARSPHKARVRALITDSAFSDYRAIVREKLAGFFLTWAFQWPLSFTIDGDHRPLEAIAEISPVPVLTIHGLADQVVPPHHGEALHAAAGEPKELWLLPDSGHIKTFLDPANRARLLDYLRRCDPGRANPSNPAG